MAGEAKAERSRKRSEDRERSGGERFRRTNVEEWLGAAKTKAAQRISYGIETGQIEDVGGYWYVCRNGRGGSKGVVVFFQNKNIFLL